jgi:hypothetical protein
VDLIHLAQFRDKWWGISGEGNEPSGSIKCEEFLDWLKNYNRLKRDLVVICTTRILRWSVDITMIHQLHRLHRGIRR